MEKGVLKNSYWLLEVAESGSYEFELRRWPKESGISLMGSSNKGISLPISAARISISSEEKVLNARKLVNDDDESVFFTFKLNSGNIALHTWFDDKNSEALVGAYYVYVTKK